LNEILNKATNKVNLPVSNIDSEEKRLGRRVLGFKSPNRKFRATLAPKPKHILLISPWMTL